MIFFVKIFEKLGAFIKTYVLLKRNAYFFSFGLIYVFMYYCFLVPLSDFVVIQLHEDLQNILDNKFLIRHLYTYLEVDINSTYHAIILNSSVILPLLAFFFYKLHSRLLIVVPSITFSFLSKVFYGYYTVQYIYFNQFGILIEKKLNLEDKKLIFLDVVEKFKNIDDYKSLSTLDFNSVLAILENLNNKDKIVDSILKYATDTSLKTTPEVAIEWAKFTVWAAGAVLFIGIIAIVGIKTYNFAFPDKPTAPPSVSPDTAITHFKNTEEHIGKALEHAKAERALLKEGVDTAQGVTENLTKLRTDLKVFSNDLKSNVEAVRDTADSAAKSISSSNEAISILSRSFVVLAQYLKHKHPEDSELLKSLATPAAKLGKVEDFNDLF